MKMDNEYSNKRFYNVYKVVINLPIGIVKNCLSPVMIERERERESESDEKKMCLSQ